jgi:hypothetical protein
VSIASSACRASGEIIRWSLRLPSHQAGDTKCGRVSVRVSVGGEWRTTDLFWACYSYVKAYVPLHGIHQHLIVLAVQILYTPKSH